MLKTGQHKEEGSRQTGPRLLFRLHTGTSTPMHVSGSTVDLHAVARAQALPGWANNSIPQVSKGYNGYRETTWFTITALIDKGSLRVFQKNAQSAVKKF